MARSVRSFLRRHPSGIPRILLLAPVLLLAAVPARAQRFWPGVVDTIRVTAPRPDRNEPAARIGNAAVIPLGTEAPVGRDLTDLLDRTAGIHVHRYGGLGAFTLASVRGSSPGQVLVCIDGVPVSSSGEGFVNLAVLPVSSFARAEVYRGSQTQTFGGPPAAGVINLVTPGALETPLRFAAGVGSFGTAELRGQWGRAWRGSDGLAPEGPTISGFLSGQGRRSRGDFSYTNRNGTFYGNTADDRIERRANNDFQEAAFLWKASIRGSSPSALRADYTGQAYDRDGGVPGTESIQTRHVRFRAARVRHEIAVASAAAGVRPAIEAAAHQEWLRDRYDNRDGEVGLGRARTDNRTRERGARLAVEREVSPAGRLRATMEMRNERWTPRDLLTPDPPGSGARNRRHRTIALEDGRTAGRFRFEGAWRWARALDDFAPVGDGGSALRPGSLSHSGASFGMRVDLGRGLLLRANRGALARFPSFPELFGQNGIQEGNPQLRPERGVQWDAGFTWAPGSPFRVEAQYFESMTRDRIALIQNSQRTTKAQNLDRAWTRGLESTLFGAVPLPRALALELQGSLTLQEARDLGPNPAYHGRTLPNLPVREAWGSARMRRGAWSARWEVAARSSSFRDRYNSEPRRTPAYALHDLSLERTFGSWNVRVEMRNAADVRVEDIDGFPLPGRALMTEVSWTR